MEKNLESEVDEKLIILETEYTKKNLKSQSIF